MTGRVRSGFMVLVLVAVCFLASCAQNPSYRPRVSPRDLITPRSVIPDIHCGEGGLSDLRRASGGGVKEKRGATWWDLQSWQTERGCEVSVWAFAHSSESDARQNFRAQEPQVVYKSTWPWKPKMVKAPDSLGADAVEVLCLGGSPEAGCKNWIYWARYGEYLVQASYFALAAPGVTLGEKDFFSLVSAVDGQVVRALGS